MTPTAPRQRRRLRPNVDQASAAPPASKKPALPRSKAKKNHRALLKPILLLLALVATGGLYALASPGQVSVADTPTSIDIDAGRKLFIAAGCSSCHGLNGEGTAQGPSLVGVGSASVDFQMSTGRMPAAAPGPQLPRNINKFSPEEIRLIGAYVGTFGPGISIPDPSQYSTEGLTEEDIARGGELFRNNCSACHNFSGQGGALPRGGKAPPLVGVGGKVIWEAMRTGPQQMPVFPQATLSDKEVRSIIAYLERLNEAPTGGHRLGGLGPVVEGLFGWLVGIGVLIVFAVWITAKTQRVR